MERILIPSDFTEVSVNAIDYALQWLGTDTLVTLLHVATGTLDVNEPIDFDKGISKSDALKAELNQLVLNELNLESLPPNTNIKITGGDIVHEIVREVKNGGYTQIVMGTRDKYDFLDRWIGTISLGVIKSVDIPVTLIPRYSRFLGFKKVMVASDYHLSNPEIIHKIRNWNIDHKAFVKFLHIQVNSTDTFEDESILLVRELFEKQEPDFGFEIDIFKERRIADSLLASAYNFHADALIVMPENQNFISSLLFKTVSKELILKSSIPIFFIR